MVFYSSSILLHNSYNRKIFKDLYDFLFMAYRGEKNFQEHCEEQIRRGDSYASQFLKDGKNSLALALEEARRKGVPEARIQLAEEKGMMDGSFEITYEGAERIYQKMQDIVKKEGSKVGRDYASVLERFDPVRDSDLITTGMFCFSPEIREKFHNQLNTLYRV